MKIKKGNKTMKLKDIYCEFRQNGEILVIQGLKRKEDYVSSYHSAFENFKKTLEFYNFGKELEIHCLNWCRQ